MKKIAFTLLAASALAACTAAPFGPKPGSVHDVTFDCAHGESVRVRFDREREMAVLVRQGEEIALPQQRSGSGFVYSNGPNTIRGKGDNLTVEVGRMAPIECVARQ